MDDKFKQQISAGLLQIHSSVNEDLLSILFQILSRYQSNNKNVQSLLMYFGSWQDYGRSTINELLTRSSLNDREQRQLNIVANRTLLTLLKIWQNIFGGNPFKNSGELDRRFENLKEDNRVRALNSLHIFLVKQDKSYRTFVQPVNKKTSINKNNRSEKSSKENTVLVKKPRVKSKPITPQKQVAQELKGNSRTANSKSNVFLDTRNGQSHYDRSFEDVNGKISSSAWKPELQVGKAVSKATNKQPLSYVYGYTMSDPQLGILARLKSYYSQTRVLSPHALEIVFSPNGPFARISTDVQIEAMYLIAYFVPENDWETFADVCHGRYLSDLIYRRKFDWADLATINEKNGLISQFLDGTFPFRYRETAFWFYLARWGYIRSDNSNLKDGPYLQADEANYSKEDQRILATIRQTVDQTGRHAGSNGKQYQQLLRLAKDNTVRGQAVLSLVEAMLGLYMYNQTSEAAYDQKRASAVIESLNNKLDNGKLSEQMKQNASASLVNNPVLSQYLVIIHQLLPGLVKRQQEYEQTDRQRKVK